MFSLLPHFRTPLSIACRIACALALIFCSLPAMAAPAQPATFTVSVQPETVRPGEYASVQVTAKVVKPWHIYSVVPAPPPAPEPTSLDIETGPLEIVGETRESRPKVAMDNAFGKEIAYHEGTATFTRIVKAPSGAAPGQSVPLAITLGYMACDDRVCLPPRDISLKASLGIEAGPVRPEFAAAPPADLAPGPQEPASVPVRSTSGMAIVPFLLAAFGAGLLALLTPCVFPMIPVTLAFFTKQAAGPGGNDAPARGRIVRLAATYSLGIVLAFTAIGAVMAATVGAAGANRIAANPWVNLAFAVLFVVFGLALLEVMEIRLPPALQKLAAGPGSRGGTLGVLGMGLAFVIAAFTCTAPFVGTVLVAAAQATTGAQWLRPILGMTAFSAALALPFFLLALFPGWLGRLPRSGAWLSTMKGVFGFVELAAALKFLSNVDMVWQTTFLTQPVLLALWALLSLAAAAWLLGLLRVGPSAPEGRPTRARMTVAAAFAAIALYCFWGLSGRPLGGWVVAFLPPSGYGLPHGTADVAGEDELPWHDTLEAGLAAARTDGKPLLIDFTGYTCTNCRLMEKNVFPQPAVRKHLEGFTRVRLYTDGGADGPKNQQYQEKTFRDVALPLYAVLSPDGKPVSHTTGSQSPEEFAAFLKGAGEKAVQPSVATSRGENPIRSQATQ